MIPWFYNIFQSHENIQEVLHALLQAVGVIEVVYMLTCECKQG